MIAAVLLLAQIAPVIHEPKPLATNIAAIRANPKKFDGELVRVTGWVNACQPSSCSVDERAANSPNGPGQRLTVTGETKFYDTIRPLIPTYVELDARVNSACVSMTSCPGGAAALTVVTLRGVVSTEPPPFEN
jgi:hypothetical protein